MKNREAEQICKEKWKILTKKGIDAIKHKDPGVYVISWSKIDLNNKCVTCEEVYYIGMSNAKAGVRGRLKQFWNGITNGVGHSAGNRWKENNGKYNPKDKKKFYFSYILYKCIVNKKDRTPNDLRIMGNVTKLEYELMALYKENMDKEPKGNKK
jgi:hypothetical protein